jgi:hypothetical protein
MRSSVSTKPIMTEPIEGSDQAIEIFLLKPELTFRAQCGVFRVEGATKEDVVTRLREMVGTPLLDWIPVISFRYSLGSQSISLILNRAYVAKGAKGWFISGVHEVVKTALVLDDKDTRNNNLLPLPETLSDDQRKALFAKSQSCHSLRPGVELGAGVHTRDGGDDVGLLPFDESLWKRLLLLQDCIHRAGSEIAALLATPEGILRLQTTPLSLTLTQS